jgi:uncharacterized protein (DUF302 family)
MTATTDNGIVHLTTSRSVGEVLEHLLFILQTKGITIFAVVDHSGEAAKVGFEMRATKLVIFGNPKAGTPLMIAAPDSALDLPLKILIAEEPSGNTRVAVALSYGGGGSVTFTDVSAAGTRMACKALQLSIE